MLSHDDNELMCRSGPGTPMGQAMRRFWMPVATLTDLPEPGGDPRALELLGEQFVLWRDAAGRPGLFADGCAHRGASMLLARAEEDGLRCIYHGWKFAVDGSVLDVPNVTDAKFKQRIKGRAYPVREAGGLLWAYLGPKDKEPPFPAWPFMEVSEEHRITTTSIVDSNYVQVIEGFVDSSHLTILHSTALARTNGEDLDFAKKTNHMQFDAAPKLEADATDFGFHYVAMRPSGDKVMARVASFVAPFSVANPNGNLWLAAVPMNDERCYFFHVLWDEVQKVGLEPLRSKQKTFTGLDTPTLEQYGMTWETCDGPRTMKRENRFLQDRELMRQGHFSGFASFNQEDAACCVSAGGIRDRSYEMLCAADVGIARLYRALLDCAKAARDGREIPGADLQIGHVRGISAEIEAGADWRSLVPDHGIVSR
ncbi:Rieske 2Fe-2S domain-containing protein [Hydrogenophaga sp. BPS33]|uniref:Rieske 2Fe-2S domain-containing protein n=1 Tax=Hydrogenophaga sp. BPS33 TaxID=2651974 RepID=UPI00131F5205|nr:Rieske 2Fe-2S domain-containing protein [Hydrogenophaga sp. BPS33]QHE85509.1 Rieske 2Fe-2S domain-containing protein [Hydrogenophaga sp. BPS33]